MCNVDTKETLSKLTHQQSRPLIPRQSKAAGSGGGQHFGREGARNLSRVSFLILIFVRDYLRRSRPWVQIAKAAIAGQHIRIARLESAVLAIPVHSACPDVYYCSPRGITKSLARRSSKRRRRCKSSDTKPHFRKGFQHPLKSPRRHYGLL
jgi:hypothetical protein